MPDFLLEIGTEEIPARMIEARHQELQKRVGGIAGRKFACRIKGSNARKLRVGWR